MFHYATSFNQPIGNWDVSGVPNFVSNDQSVRFNTFNPVSMLDVESIITDVWLLKEALSTNRVLHYFLVLGVYVSLCNKF